MPTARPVSAKTAAKGSGVPARACAMPASISSRICSGSGARERREAHPFALKLNFLDFYHPKALPEGELKQRFKRSRQAKLGTAKMFRISQSKSQPGNRHACAYSHLFITL